MILMAMALMMVIGLLYLLIASFSTHSLCAAGSSKVN